MLTLIITSAMLAQPVGGEFEFGIVEMIDRGRLTPFGRTYDVYLNTNGRVPSFLHAGRTWICDPDNVSGPLDTRGKENKNALISFDNFNGKDALWFNYHNPFAPLADIRTVPGMDQWYRDNDPEWWDCQLGNYLNKSYFNQAVPIEWYLDANGIPKRRWDAAALDYFWADTWMLMGDPGILLDQNGYPYFPNMEEQWADWMYPWEPGGDNSSVFISKPAIEEITDSYRCPPTPSNPDSGVLIRFPSTIPGADWDENGMFKIMRVTGPIERARFNFYITYEDLGNPAPGQTTCDVNRQDYAYTTFVLGQDLNPTDLNEDGATDFGDLLIVISDVAAGKYYGSKGFEAMLEVLSGWGPNQ
jgi:hypothetical protein